MSQEIWLVIGIYFIPKVLANTYISSLVSSIYLFYFSAYEINAQLAMLVGNLFCISGQKNYIAEVAILATGQIGCIYQFDLLFACHNQDIEIVKKEIWLNIHVFAFLLKKIEMSGQLYF